jgi:N2-acetyl-L-2,4-diaminobutanoate deacetylase
MTTEEFGPQLTVDLSVDGVQMGYLKVPLGCSQSPLREHRAPLCVIRNGAGPTVCVLSGTDAGYATGTTVIQKLFAAPQANAINGTLILIPALFTPQSLAAQHSEQLRRINEVLAEQLLQHCDAVIELGSAAQYVEVAANAVIWNTLSSASTEDAEALMAACGAPFSVRRFDPPAANSIAELMQPYNGVFLKLDIGQYNSTDKLPQLLGVSTLRNALLHLSVLNEGPFTLQATRILEVSRQQHFIDAPTQGLLHWFVDLGGTVHRGNPIAAIYSTDDPFRPPTMVDARLNGILLAKLDNALTRPGQLLAIVADEVPC